MIDLASLTSALSVIGNVGKLELTFDVDGTPVTIRTLTADEDIAADGYARVAFQTVDESSTSESTDVLQGVQYTERWKRAILGYAICQVGTLDLRGVQHIATGEHTDSGVPIKIEKHVAIRKLMDTWTRAATHLLLQKFIELSRQSEAKSEEAIQWDPSELDAEVARVEGRLNDLQKEKNKSSFPIGTADLAEKVSQASDVLHRNAGGGAVSPRVPVTKNVSGALPPVRVPDREESPPERATEGSFESVVDSMDISEESLAEEEARIIAARRAMGRPMGNINQSGLMGTSSQSRVPLNTQNAVADYGSSEPEERHPSLAPPPKSLVARARPEPVPAAINQSGTAPTNPRFRKPGQG